MRTIKEDILSWSKDFLEIPNKHLNNFPVCPYAKKTRLDNHINIIELKYKPYTYYLFNNQKKHTVLNLDNKDRYVFSLYFEEETSYEILREKLKSILIKT